jgi:hypothetical protein
MDIDVKEVRRNKRFLEMEKVADEYHDNPAYVAFLKMKQAAVLSEAA